MILDGAALFRCERLSWPWEQALLAKLGRTLPPLDDVADAAIHARVNGGRWIVVCECGMPEAVWLATPFFYCHNCWNASHGGSWREIVLPPDDERAEIEQLLMARPMVNRAWFPGETPADVLTENRAHGLEG